MIEIFPEIQAFFKQAQFSDEQLSKLRDEIKIKYKDENSRKAAVSAIGIKLLQYQLSSPKAEFVNDKIKRPRIKLKSKRAGTSGKVKNKKVLKKHSKKLKVEVSQALSKSLKTKASKGKVKSIKRIKRSDNSRKSSPGVYGKLVKATSVGKLIYTRM